jgi:allophanate hydrolase subunit 1
LIVTHGDYDLILNIPDGVIDNYPEPKGGYGATGRRGYVYLIQSESGWYKIGRTINPEDRMKTFSVKLPFRVEYICLIQSEDMIALEAELHKRFEDQRFAGEWFDLTDNDVAYLKSMADES